MLELIHKQMPEHEQTQDMLSESKGYLKSLFDSIKTGIVVIDPDSHTIVDANPTVLKMVGAEKEHLLGRLCHQVICPAEIGKCPITDLKQTVDVSERVLINSKGERIPVLKSVIPVNGNNRTYLIESIHDISDRKRMEEALQKSEEEARQLAQENSAMAKLGRLLSSTLEIDEV